MCLPFLLLLQCRATQCDEQHGRPGCGTGPFLQEIWKWLHTSREHAFKTRATVTVAHQCTRWLHIATQSATVTTKPTVSLHGYHDNVYFYMLTDQCCPGIQDICFDLAEVLVIAKVDKYRFNMFSHVTVWCMHHVCWHQLFKLQAPYFENFVWAMMTKKKYYLKRYDKLINARLCNAQRESPFRQLQLN